MPSVGRLVQVAFFQRALDEITRRAAAPEALAPLAVSALFSEVVKRLVETPVTVFSTGAIAPFADQCFVDCHALAVAVLESRQVVVHAPTQSGKTCVDALVMAMSRLMKVACIVVVAAPADGVRAMAREKLPEVLRDFGVKTRLLDAKFIRELTPETAAAIGRGDESVVALWNKLDLVQQLVCRPEIGSVVLVLDESDELITSVIGEKRSKKQRELAELMRSPKLRSVVSVSATQLGWLRFMVSEGLRVDAYIGCTPEDLARVGYRGLDAIKPLVGPDGRQVWIPAAPRKPKRADFARGGDGAAEYADAKAEYDAELAEYAFKLDGAYGVESPQVAALFGAFNASDVPHRQMFLSLGAQDKKGFRPQAQHILQVRRCPIGCPVCCSCIIESLHRSLQLHHRVIAPFVAVPSPCCPVGPWSGFACGGKAPQANLKLRQAFCRDCARTPGS